MGFHSSYINDDGNKAEWTLIQFAIQCLSDQLITISKSVSDGYRYSSRMLQPVVGASNQITEGRGFKSHRGLGFFFSELSINSISCCCFIFNINHGISPKSHVFSQCTHIQLHPKCVCQEDASDKQDIPWYTMRECCITILYNAIEVKWPIQLMHHEGNV